MTVVWKIRMAACCAALALVASPAFAGRNGIAYVEAPEQSVGTCIGSSAKTAFDCARKKCVKGGASSMNCLERAYCFPANWSIDIFKQSTDGAHWHEFRCGWESKQDALDAARHSCDKTSHPNLVECAPMRLLDESGKEFPIGQ